MRPTTNNTHAAPYDAGSTQTVAFSHYNNLSAQLPIDPATGAIVAGGAAEQAEQCFKNLQAIVESIGHDMNDIIRVSIFLADIMDLNAVEKVQASFFPTYQPARTVAAVDGTASASVVSSAAADTGAENFDEFMFYLEMDDGIATDGEVNAVVDEVMARTEGLPCEVIPSTSSDSSVTSMAGSGLSITLTGDDPAKRAELSEEVAGLFDEVEAYTEIETGTEDADRELKLVIDEDALTREGWTVAQLYEYLAGREEERCVGKECRSRWSTYH